MKKISTLIVLLLTPLAALQAATPTIENKTHSVIYDDASGTFAVTEKTTGKNFLTAGKLEGAPVKARVESAKDSVFGRDRKSVV